MRAFIYFILFLFCCSSLWARSYQAAGMAVYDLNEGRFLFRQGSTTQRAPASTIKVLTALTAHHYAQDKLNDWVTISSYAASAQPTKVGMTPGEKFKLKDLLAITLVASCNDAARAVAEAVSGSEASFARDMQKLAEHLGTQKTRVTNASGLPNPGGMVTTAEDSILFIKALIDNPTLKAILELKSATMVSSEGRSITKSTHNRLLREGFKYPVLGKTGFTNAARHCFLSYCEVDGRSVAISILGEPNSRTLWEDLRYAYSSYMKARPVYLPVYMSKNGISVSKLHEKLKRAGYPVSGETIYGAATRRAVSAFQKARRLDIDGIVGPQTWSTLNP